MLYLLHQTIDRAADQLPDHEAARFQSRSITYERLAERSNQLAHTLSGLGVRRGDRVGIFRRKGLESAIAMYGIMAAGAAYVPLDPESPAARIELMVRDCGIRHIVTGTEHLETIDRLAHAGIRLQGLVGVEDDPLAGIECISWRDVEAYSTESPHIAPMEQDLAYILYTSGSTGVPKGVMHTHRSALSFAEVAAATYGFGPEDRLGNHAPLHFDLSTLDYFSAAVAGATTIIIPEAITKLPASLSKFVADERLTVLYTVPLVLTQLLTRGALDKRDLRAIRWVLFGGEPFPTKHLRSLMAMLPHARFSNIYGPTETNGVTYYIVPPLDSNSDEPIPIGRLYGNADALVIDELDRVVVEGQPGELVVRSPTMMRGYWARPELTEDVRFRVSVHGYLDDIYHRTGDLVRLQPDGNYQFLGRKDRQVKIRGSRIELDEIENVLAAHPAVEAAAVFLNGEESDRRIEAAVTPAGHDALNGAAPDSAALIAYLRQQLPPYAIPDRLVVHPSFPKTSTGKIDRLQLQVEAAAGSHTAEIIPPIHEGSH